MSFHSLMLITARRRMENRRRCLAADDAGDDCLDGDVCDGDRRCFVDAAEVTPDCLLVNARRVRGDAGSDAFLQRRTAVPVQ